MKSEDHPELVTAFSMDAPTEKQFDVPVQQRKARDVVKALDTAKRWSSKITGLLIAGVGMLAFVTRGGLGAGGDLSCTVLYLALMQMVKEEEEEQTLINSLPLLYKANRPGTRWVADSRTNADTHRLSQQAKTTQ